MRTTKRFKAGDPVFFVAGYYDEFALLEGVVISNATLGDHPYIQFPEPRGKVMQASWTIGRTPEEAAKAHLESYSYQGSVVEENARANFEKWWAARTLVHVPHDDDAMEVSE